MQLRGNKRLRSGALALMVCFVGSSVPVPASAAGLEKAGSVTGRVATPSADPLASQQVRLRSVDWGRVAAVARTDGTGSYAFAGVVPGNYIVELMGATGTVVGTSSPVIVSTGQPAAKGVLVTTAALAAAQAPGTSEGNFFRSTAGLTVMAAAAAGITGIYMSTRNSRNASPSH